MIKEFTYTDAKGKTTERYAYVLSKASDNNMMLDLTEFSEEEREYYVSELNAIMEMQRQAIAELGLRGQFRFFKQSGIQE